MRRASRSSRRILAVNWDKSAIDHNDTAARELRWRKNPIARSLHVRTQRRAGGVNQRFFAVEKFGGKRDATEFRFALLQHPPAVTRRQIPRTRREARVQSRDQVLLPGLAVKLPQAESDQNRNTGEREHGCIEHRSAAFALQLFPHASPRRSRRPSAAW